MRRLARACAVATYLVVGFTSGAQGQQISAQRIAILDVREEANKLRGEDRKAIDARALIDHVRRAALKALPELSVVMRESVEMLLKVAGSSLEACEGLCAVETGQKISADYVVAANLRRSEGKIELVLDLYETRLARPLSSATASGRTERELEAAVRDAVDELVAPLKGQKADNSRVAVSGKKQLGEVPALSGKLSASVMNLDVDTDVLVLYEAALKAEAVAKDQPAAAAHAWKALSEAPGRNPYKDEAAQRARQWHEFAEEQRKLTEQRKSDHDQLVKLLPLTVAVAESLKEELLLRYARLYGAGDIEPLLRLIPNEQSRSNARASVECELAKKADRCEQAASVHEAAKEWKLAVGFHEKGCELGSGKSCERLGALLLGAEGTKPDPERARLALQRACEAGTAAGCRKLARGLSDGSLGAPDQARVLQLYGKACDLRDGESCASVGILTLSAHPGDQALATPWFRRACEYGQRDGCERVAAQEKAAAEAKSERDRVDRERLAAEQKIRDDQQRERDRVTSAARAVRDARQGEADSIRTRRRWGYGLSIAGVALAGGATFFALKGKSSNDQLASGGLKTAADQQAILDQGKTYNTLTLALGAAAVVGVAIGIPLILFNSESKEPKVSLLATPSGMLLSWRWP